MSDKRYLGNIITNNPTAPAGNFQGSAAKGVWSLEEQLAYQKAGLWPIPGNLPVDITDVFSTYLYDGNGSTQTITNGIDLAGEGGLTWIKIRGGFNAPSGHHLYDTERGATKKLRSDSSDAEDTVSTGLTAFNSNGFALGANVGVNGGGSGDTYASWTFRKAEKFFDVVTYTGNGVQGRSIAHNLGSTPGCIIVKKTNAAGTDWAVYHRGVDASSPEGYHIRLNTTAARQATIYTWGNTAPTSTAFFVGNSGFTNNNTDTYVAYLFAHNDGDGNFGPDGSDIIKCGSYTGNGSATGPSVNLGFEPQWLLIRNVDRADDWVLIDAMRGIPSSSDGPAVLRPESSAVEYASGSSFSQASRVDLTATGFDVKSSNSRVNGSSQNMIYIAIRRGPLAPPESATDVFAISDRKNEIPSFPSGFPVDFLIGPRTINGTDNNEVKTRLISGGYLRTNTTGAENASSQVANFAHNDGFFNFSGANTNQYSWMWKRAPNYMDVVAFESQASGTAKSFNHSLSVIPEMVWLKNRPNSDPWIVYHKDTGTSKYLGLQSNGVGLTQSNWITLSDSAVSGISTSLMYNNSNYIAYLFASLAGISKVGSVTHSGTTNVDCGFTSGARFVLLKRTDASGDWYIWDSTRGIVSGNDPYLLLNTTAAEVTNTDYIDPLSSGFTITSSFTAGTYIFYAIA